MSIDISPLLGGRAAPPPGPLTRIFPGAPGKVTSGQVGYKQGAGTWAPSSETVGDPR